MAINDFLTLATLALAVLIVTPFLGRYIHRVMEGERVFLSPVVRPVERLIYRVSGIDETAEQSWKGYAVSVLVLAFVAIVAGYAVLRLQDVLPLNQGGITAMSPELAFNTSVSFETNTNWQNYSGETGATYLTQAAMLAVRNFTSAATGLAIAIALFRGLTRRTSKTIGNYWVDFTRGILYILLPIAVVGAIVLVWQGVPQTWDPNQTITTLQGGQQSIAFGPIASQEFIKELGNNGGGFLNANSAHPFESPTPLTNWLEMFAILIMPFALTYTFGRYAANQRQGWTIAGAMALILVVGAVVAMNHEFVGNPLFPAGVDQAGVGNMEGKEVRFGAALGGLFGAITTGTSTGAINAWHDSFQPIAGLVPLLQHGARRDQPGRHRRRHVRDTRHRRDPGGVHRRPHGRPHARSTSARRSRPSRSRWPCSWRSSWEPASSASRRSPASLPEGTAGPLNPGAHGFSEILYAFSSQTANNGSAFGGLTGNTPFYNITGGLAMLIGRYGMIVPILALAGSMAAKRVRRPVARDLPDHGRPVGRPPDRCRDHRRRAHVLPGAGAGSDRRAAHPERGKGLLMALMSVDLGRGTRRFQRFVTLGGAKPGGEAPKPRGVLDPDLLRSAIPHAFRKLDPRLLIKNPVMFVVEITAVLVTLTAIADATGAEQVPGGTGLGFEVQIAIWLWFTVLFATYAEAVAEARGRAQAATLRKTRSETTAHRRTADGSLEDVGSSELRKGDVIVVEEGETIAGDGDVIEGIGFVNEAAITGESAPVLKEPGTDIRSSVTGGTSLVSDRIVVRVTTDPGETFLDRMIALVEGAKRQRTPNEIALAILLAGLSVIFLMATVTLRPFGLYAGTTVQTVALIALLVCLIPTTIGGLLSAIGIAGMDRVARFNVLAMSGRAVEASGDVDVILLDKTGTITYGNRLAASITAAPGVTEAEAVEAALVASIRDETPEGRSVVDLARKRLTELGRPAGDGDDAGFAALDATIVEEIAFRAETRTSGVKTAAGPTILKGAIDAIEKKAGSLPAEVTAEADRISDLGATPLILESEGRVLGTIELKDTVKEGLVERFAEFRRMGIRTVMITGDNPRTAATIAKEAGVDDFIAQATPEEKIAFIRDPAGRGPPRGHDRRRHERRPGARAVRRRARDEQRYVGGQGRGQHGRPRLRSYQAARGHRDRQAAADHARFDHDVLDRQRRGEVLRDRAGPVRGRSIRN